MFREDCLWKIPKYKGAGKESNRRVDYFTVTKFE